MNDKCNEKYVNLTQYTDEIKLTEASYIDGSIHCIFERKALTTINDQIFDLNKIPNHLLLAIGNEVNGNMIDYYNVIVT